MENDLSRRKFIGVSGMAVAAGAMSRAASAQAASEETGDAGVKIVGVSCSPRPGKTTASALTACLEAAKELDPANVDTELIELAGLEINGNVAAGVPLEPGRRDDFPQLVPKLADSRVGGIIVGSPVYFCNMSSLCKAFLDRCIAFRKDDFALAGKVAGALAVGGARNGGQEMTVQTIQAALLCQNMILVGTGGSSTRPGAMAWSRSDQPITDDEVGMATARDLGKRVAELAMRLHGFAP